MSDNVDLPPPSDKPESSQLSQHGAELLTTPGLSAADVPAQSESSIDAQFGSGDIFQYQFAGTSMWRGGGEEAKMMAAVMGGKFAPITEQIRGVGAALALGHGAINT